jgi:hypothetical protein
MEKKSILKTIKAENPYEYQGVKNYPWSVQFENGDTGKITTRKETPPYEVGKEYPYDISEQTDKNGNKWNKIKRVDLNQGGFKKADPTIKLRSFAISYANRFVIQDIVPRPDSEDKLINESSEDWNKFLSVISKYSAQFYKEMLHDCTVYGFQYADVIGTSLSNAIEARISKKIRKDMIFPYYRNLLDSVLKKQETPQVNQQ